MFLLQVEVRPATDSVKISDEAIFEQYCNCGLLSSVTTVKKNGPNYGNLVPNHSLPVIGAISSNFADPKLLWNWTKEVLSSKPQLVIYGRYTNFMIHI